MDDHRENPSPSGQEEPVRFPGIDSTPFDEEPEPEPISFDHLDLHTVPSSVSEDEREPEKEDGEADVPEEPSDEYGQEGDEEDEEQNTHRRRTSVFQYIAVLFAAAFILLLFTYLMERRQYEQREQHDQQQIENLNQQSVSAVQSLEDLYDQNDALSKRVEELEGLLKDAQSNTADNAAATEETQRTLERTRVAMDWFWQLDEAFVLNRLSLCRDIIGILDADQPDSLSSYLPKESATDNLRFSPYDRYMEIRDAVA